MAETRSIIISGGGIAGLSAALALADLGYRIDVLEQAPRFDAIGAGIQISPNALRILDSFGIGDQLRLVGTAPQGIKILSSNRNKCLKTIPLGSHALIRYGLPYLSMHRSDLHTALLSACEANPDIDMTMAVKVSDYTEHQNGVSVMAFAGDRMRTYRGSMLVIAEGVNSQLRQSVFQAPPAHYSGFTAYRAIIHHSNVPNNIDMDFTHLIWGRNHHGVLYPVRKGQYLNVVLIKKSKNTDLIVNKHIKHQEILTGLGSWNSTFKSLFTACDEWSAWPVLTTKFHRAWSRDKAVMIGDAAHGMVPFAAQGAGLAIEDSAVLANCVKTYGANQQAFKQFETSRFNRTRKVEKLAKTNGELFHMGFPFSTVRNIGMGFVSAERLLERQSWIYDWRI